MATAYTLPVPASFRRIELLIEHCRATLAPELMFDGTDAIDLMATPPTVTVSYTRELSEAEQALVAAAIMSYDEEVQTAQDERLQLRWDKYALPNVRCFDSNTFQRVLSWHDPLDGARLRRAIITSRCTPRQDSLYEMRIVDLCMPVIIASGTYSNISDALATEMAVNHQGRTANAGCLPNGQYINPTQELQVRLGPGCERVDITSVALGWLP